MRWMILEWPYTRICYKVPGINKILTPEVEILVSSDLWAAVFQAQGSRKSEI